LKSRPDSVGPSCVNKNNSQMYLVVEQSTTPAINNKRPPKIII
jgi:hypothetical protein